MTPNMSYDVINTRREQDKKGEDKWNGKILKKHVHVLLIVTKVCA